LCPSQGYNGVEKNEAGQYPPQQGGEELCFPGDTAIQQYRAKHEENGDEDRWYAPARLGKHIQGKADVSNRRIRLNLVF